MTQLSTNSWFDRLETLGNKIPHPLYLFVGLCALIAITSWVMSLFNPTLINPVNDQVVPIRTILSHEGLVYVLQSTVNNFVNFKPLGLVLSMMIAVGIMQEVGLADATIKTLLLNAPKRFITMMVFFVGIVGNLASDAAFVLVPPLAGIIFAATKRNPIVGICAGFVAVAAGFTANIFIAGTDVLLSSVTNEVLITVSTEEITPAANWYFMLLSVPFLMITGTWITEKIIEPRFSAKDDIDVAHLQQATDHYQVTPIEKRAVKFTGIYALLFIMGLIMAIWPSDSPFRNGNGGLVPSPFLSGMIPIIMAFFISCSIVYGILAKKITRLDDVPTLMTQSLKNVGGYIILVFFVAQFIAWFNWTNLSLYLAIGGANILSAIAVPNVFMLALLMVLAGFINLIIFSGSAQWSLMAPVFIPLFVLLGIEPAAIQMAYRIGDSTTNVISPTNPYLPMVLAVIAQYNPKFKFGTFLSIMMPYATILLITWGILFLIYYSLGLPLGPA
ncbi:AbgT family transporter [Wohlfahrtiimonas chitiniclastica]|uniref:AbgT family transporter n=1 Tax=Wohlfahrtiimonas chitiniclastica TaxID=400946 RepID=UPI001BCB8E0E|nr:AbgT family transporter [Wohlfahrtiimonas chitiniclastica]MBS7835966.1 AbgT family transporter [Wohlfahrtiimonas chitiniclastica]